MPDLSRWLPAVQHGRHGWTLSFTFHIVFVSNITSAPVSASSLYEIINTTITGRQDVMQQSRLAPSLLLSGPMNYIALPI